VAEPARAKRHLWTLEAPDRASMSFNKFDIVPFQCMLTPMSNPISHSSRCCLGQRKRCWFRQLNHHHQEKIAHRTSRLSRLRKKRQNVKQQGRLILKRRCWLGRLEQQQYHSDIGCTLPSSRTPTPTPISRASMSTFSNTSPSTSQTLISP
jgi:hypothetical protein